MKSNLIMGSLLAALALLSWPSIASALTCNDQHKACLARGHTDKECTSSTNACLQTGRWIGPAGVEYPITTKE